MNRAKLKAYAPQARRDFIRAVTDRAATYGLTAAKIESVILKGDVAVIGGTAFPAAVAEKRERLEERIERFGFEQTMEAMAYTWFNRLVAIRFMELHQYLDHGYRVLSHPDASKTIPEIVEHAEHVDLPGLDKQKVIDLKLDGTREGELYRMLLIAQCNALNAAMPFLFERIADETELLLPENLLHSDSLVRKLVTEIDEADWQEVVIIGWLYQFYIADKKAEVIGSVVTSEDIPAATQLFTPNWIVKYLVQNSLGRQWLATYPDSPMKAKMEFYIEPAEQTPEVQAELKKITPESLNPEDFTFLDPACGSGHILVEAYSLLKGIYLERGYRLRDIPKLILTKNLFGLEIDDRAAQLAAFALLMIARADDRNILSSGVTPNVLAIQQTDNIDADALLQAFTHTKLPPKQQQTSGEFGFMDEARAPLYANASAPTPAADPLVADLRQLLDFFNGAKTFGSLLQVPLLLAGKLAALRGRVSALQHDTDLTTSSSLGTLDNLIRQANFLTRQYNCVAANPPYMNRKYFCRSLDSFMKREFPDCAVDVYVAFIRRCITYCRPTGHVAMITMDSWMFGEDFAEARDGITSSAPPIAIAHLGARAFDEISGEVVQTSAFVLSPSQPLGWNTVFFRLTEPKTSDGKRDMLLARQNRFVVPPGYFDVFPRRAMAYFATAETRAAFASGKRLADFVEAFTGLQTGDNEAFIRHWAEVRVDEIGFGLDRECAKKSHCRWFPYVKGSEYRKWYGNLTFVVNWKNDGAAIRSHRSATVRNSEHYFSAGLAYNNIAKKFSARLIEGGAIFDQKNSMFIAKNENLLPVALGFLHSTVIQPLLKVVAPKDFNPGSLKEVPISPETLSDPLIERNVDEMVSLAKIDWNAREASWGFETFPLISGCTSQRTLREACEAYANACEKAKARTRELEEANNHRFAEVYGLEGKVDCSVAGEDVTLRTPTLSCTLEELASYAIGCAMGRYSLDKPGLIYAKSGNEGFDPGHYQSFPADKDGIIPVMELDWFDDAATHRFEEFVGVAWPKEHMEENLKFVADSLGPKNGEQSRDTIRRYFADDFYKQHLQTYKRRPIYWLFTSGKLGAFQCLVYLHRYNEGTLARMRREYVIPLQGKIAARIEKLEGDKGKATSSSHRNKVEKEQDKLRKQQQELIAFDAKLRHYADLRIKLDLGDGVKVNYRKFADPSIGEIVAEVKAVCGKEDEE